MTCPSQQFTDPKAEARKTEVNDSLRHGPEKGHVKKGGHGEDYLEGRETGGTAELEDQEHTIICVPEATTC